MLVIGMQSKLSARTPQGDRRRASALRDRDRGGTGSNFEEWVRGFWAARCQMASAGIKKRKKR